MMMHVKYVTQIVKANSKQNQVSVASVKKKIYIYISKIEKLRNIH